MATRNKIKCPKCGLSFNTQDSILLALRKRMTPTEISRVVSITSASVIYQLRVLEGKGLVKRSNAFGTTIYSRKSHKRKLTRP